MKGHTNNPNGRPTKGNEKRKAVTAVALITFMLLNALSYGHEHH